MPYQVHSEHISTIAPTVASLWFFWAPITRARSVSSPNQWQAEAALYIDLCRERRASLAMPLLLMHSRARLFSVIINNGDCLAAGYKLNTIFSATCGPDCSRHTNPESPLYVHKQLLRLIDGLQLSFFFLSSLLGFSFYFSCVSSLRSRCAISHEGGL